MITSDTLFGFAVLSMSAISLYGFYKAYLPLKNVERKEERITHVVAWNTKRNRPILISSPNNSMECNHHDLTKRYNYFRYIASTEDGTVTKYIQCTQCLQKWSPEKAKEECVHQWNVGGMFIWCGKCLKRDFEAEKKYLHCQVCDKYKSDCDCHKPEEPKEKAKAICGGCKAEALCQDAEGMCMKCATATKYLRKKRCIECLDWFITDIETYICSKCEPKEPEKCNEYVYICKKCGDAVACSSACLCVHSLPKDFLK